MPIQFTCPHCGSQTSVAEQYAGQTGPCAHCGKTVTVPMFGTAGGPAMPPPKSSSTTPVLLILAGVAVVCFCLVGPVLVALLLPAVQAAREAARRSQCTNNLKQIALALQSYHDTWNSLPPPYVADASGRPMHSWRVLILPYLEEQALYEEYDLSEPWDGPNNSLLAARMPRVFACPSDPATGQNTTHYLAIVGQETVFDPTRPIKLSELASQDGTANTLMVVESTEAVNWMEPRDLNFNEMSFTINDPAGNAIGSHHPGGAVVTFADGSVQFLRDDLDTQSVRGLVTKSGGEVVNAY